VKITKALHSWGVQELSNTLTHFNSYLASIGDYEGHSLDETSIQVEFVEAPEIRCPEGHLPIDGCFASIPARPVIRVSGRTNQGQLLANEKHVGDFRILDFLVAIVKAGDNELTV
jgi:hypothetical protein